MEFEVVVTNNGFNDTISPDVWSIKESVMEEVAACPLVCDHQIIVAP
jgi:hypothetical protein